MIEYTEKEFKSMMLKELKKYEAAIGHITPDERKGLRKWVKRGNSPYDNPCLLWDEDGRTMDFITAIRIWEDMCNNPKNYHFGESSGDDSDIDEIPF